MKRSNLIKIAGLLGAFASAAVVWLQGDQNAAYGIICASLSSATVNLAKE